MSCQFLSGRQIKMCAAFEGTLVLSTDELEAFCSNPNWQHCKIYQKYQNGGHKLPLRDYRKNYVLPSV